MALHIKNLSINGNRKEIRSKLINEFINEEPGLGKKELCSRYKYFVEESFNGDKIYLLRPANLNKGMDFTIHVENCIFHSGNLRDMPRHGDIIEDLNIKKDNNEIEYLKVVDIINKLYKCEEIDNSEYENLNFEVGHPIEVVLKAIKWLFIEQDITYWNWSGREMFYNKLKDNNLC